MTPIKGNLGWDDFKEGKEGKEYEKKSKIKIHGNGFQTSTGQGRISGKSVETLRHENVNGYQVTVNRHNGDSDNLQIFIDKGNTSIVEYISMDRLDEFIYNNTR